jgi:uncharacterized phage infection (PIP) family protein YhgE
MELLEEPSTLFEGSLAMSEGSLTLLEGPSTLSEESSAMLEGSSELSEDPSTLLEGPSTMSVGSSAMSEASSTLSEGSSDIAKIVTKARKVRDFFSRFGSERGRDPIRGEDLGINCRLAGAER